MSLIYPFIFDSLKMCPLLMPVVIFLKTKINEQMEMGEKRLYCTLAMLVNKKPVLYDKLQYNRFWLVLTKLIQIYFKFVFIFLFFLNRTHCHTSMPVGPIIVKLVVMLNKGYEECQQSC